MFMAANRIDDVVKNEQQVLAQVFPRSTGDRWSISRRSCPRNHHHPDDVTTLEDASGFMKVLTVLGCVHTTKQEVIESHNKVHESVAEEKVAKRRTNSKSTMLSVKILNLVDWTQTVSIQEPESLSDSVVWNIGCVRASVLKGLGQDKWRKCGRGAVSAQW